VVAVTRVLQSSDKRIGGVTVKGLMSGNRITTLSTLFFKLKIMNKYFYKTYLTIGILNWATNGLSEVIIIKDQYIKVNINE